MPPVPKLRVVHPTDDLEAVIRFYRDRLVFAVLYRFEDHDGWVMGRITTCEVDKIKPTRAYTILKDIIKCVL